MRADLCTVAALAHPAVIKHLKRLGVDAIELMADGAISLVVNSPRGRGSRADGAHIRRAAGEHRVPLVTTGAAALAAARGMAEWATTDLEVRTLQEYHLERTEQSAEQPA